MLGVRVPSPTPSTPKSKSSPKPLHSGVGGVILRYMHTTRHYIAASMLLAMALMLQPSRSFAAQPQTETSDEYAFKIAVERHLEEKLNTVLKEVTGTENLVAVVSAEVRTIEESKEDKEAASKDADVKDVRIVLLPGVPARDQISKAAPLLLPRRAAGSPPVVVSRLGVTVLLDKTVSQELIKMVHDVAISLIGYNPDRGDTLDVKQMEFLSKSVNWLSIFEPPHVYWLVIMLLGGAFLSASAYFFANPFRRLPDAIEKLGSSGGAAHQHGAPMPLAAQYQQAVAPAHHADEERERMDARPFSFITEESLAHLAHLLHGYSAEDVAIIANYLRPELAGALLGMLPHEKQEAALELLLDVMDLGLERVSRLEEAVRGRLMYMVGGTERLSSILSLADDETRDRVFEALEHKNEQKAEELKRKVRSFESIIRSLRPAGISALVMNLDQTTFAQVLRSTSADIQSRVAGALSAGAAERLQEEIRYSRPMSAGRLNREKQNIVLQYQKLVKAGLIDEDED